MALWFVNATENHSALPAIAQQAHDAGQLIHLLHHPSGRDAILKSLPPHSPFIRLVEVNDGDFALPISPLDNGTEIFFLPCAQSINFPELRRRPPLGFDHCIQPLVADPPGISPRHYVTGPAGWFGWRASGKLARRICNQPSAWQRSGVELIESIQRWLDPPRWQSIPLEIAGIDIPPVTAPGSLTTSSRVLTVISFYGCEPWLHACLSSMVHQTHPAENIVVIDDCSPALPTKLLEPFPTVTLLSTTRNVGPEKILSNIIKATDYDAYMVQDADDWSSHDRLELSLRHAERTGADLIGTHEFRIDLPKNALQLCIYPPDVNHAMSLWISHHCLHGTSLISKSLAIKVGGFDERLKLAADVDFIARAWHAGRIINLPAYCLFRRVRTGSLTMHPATGYRSGPRMLEDKFINLRAMRNLQLARCGQSPNVFVEQKDPVDFIHHQGPHLCLSPTANISLFPSTGTDGNKR